MKEKHGMRWTTLRGLKKVSAQAMLVAACMNLKKMANWMWRSVETVFVCKLKLPGAVLFFGKGGDENPQRMADCSVL